MISVEKRGGKGDSSDWERRTRNDRKLEMVGHKKNCRMNFSKENQRKSRAKEALQFNGSTCLKNLPKKIGVERKE